MDWDSAAAFKGPQDSPGFTLWRDFMRWQRELNAELKPLGLTQPQFAVLAVIGWLTREGEEITQGDIVAFVGMDRMHISQIASRLEVNGLITRTASKADQRAKRVALTEVGQAVLTRALPIVEAFDRVHLGGR